jgi:heptosyltransferase II
MKARRILIVSIYGIGDVLFSTPLIRNIRKETPDAFIGYLVNRRAAPIFKNNKDVNKVYIYERDEIVQLYKNSPQAFLQKIKAMIAELRNDHFEIAIDLSANGAMAFLLWLSGIPYRTGFHYKRRSVFLNHKVPLALAGYEARHVVEYYLELSERIGIAAGTQQLELPISPEDQKWAQTVLRKAPLKPLVALVPGGGASWGVDAKLKQWPVEKYAKLADKIIEKYAATIILLGDKNERDLAARVRQGMRYKALDFCGQTDLGQLAAVLSLCDVAILNDGGPLHVAAAVGTRTVSIFGPVDENVYGPYPRRGHQVVTAPVLCRPCYRGFRRARCEHFQCLQNIAISDVERAVGEILG